MSTSEERASPADDHDSLEMIGQKLNAIATVNDEVLDTIDAVKYKPVVSGFQYSLQCDLGNSNGGADAEAPKGDAKTPWSLQATAFCETVSARLQKWKYSGDALTAADDVFNDAIDYRLRGFDDVRRLNRDLRKVGNKHVDLLADRPKTRAGALIFLRNLEQLHVITGELHALIFDAKDKVSTSETFTNGMESIVSGFDMVQRQLDGVSLKMGTGFVLHVKYAFNEGIVPASKYGKIVDIDVEPSDTIAKIKMIIWKKEGISQDQYRLVGKDGSILRDNARTLRSLGVTSESQFNIFWNKDASNTVAGQIKRTTVEQVKRATTELVKHANKKRHRRY